MNQSKSDNLVVRQHERVRCALAAEATVAPEHAAMVALSPLAADSSGKFSLSVVDVSRGGLGLKCKMFFPKQCRLTVTVTDEMAGTPLTATVKVQRVVMTDRTPSYELGTSLIDPTPELKAAVAALAERVSKSQGEKREAARG